MRRRDFIILLAPMGGWPSAVCAQQKAMPVVGFLNGGAPSVADPFMAAFQGWLEAQWQFEKVFGTKLRDIELGIRGLLRGFGLKVGKVSEGKYDARIRE